MDYKQATKITIYAILVTVIILAGMVYLTFKETTWLMNHLGSMIFFAISYLIIGLSLIIYMIIKTKSIERVSEG